MLESPRRRLTLVPDDGVVVSIPMAADVPAVEDGWRQTARTSAAGSGKSPAALVVLTYLIVIGAVAQGLAGAITWGRSLVVVGTLHVLIGTVLFVRARGQQPKPRS